MFNVEILEIWKFILDVGVFCRSFLGSSLSNRGAKLKNEFAATENQWNTGVGHVTNIFSKNPHFCWSSKSNFLLRHIVSSHFRIFSGLAWGPLAARSRRITWLVERFCRKVIPSPGWFAQFVANMGFLFFVCSSSKFWKSVHLFWCRGIFRQFFRFIAVEPWCQIEKWICSDGESMDQGGRSCDENLSKNPHFCWSSKIDFFA